MEEIRYNKIVYIGYCGSGVEQRTRNAQAVSSNLTSSSKMKSGWGNPNRIRYSPIYSLSQAGVSDFE